MVKRNEFRSDLYYRLNVFPVVLPPLRERQGDIAQLVLYFVEIYANRIGKRIKHIPEETLDAFRSYSWPGNVRELQNLVERAVIRSDDGILPNPLPIVFSNPLPASNKNRATFPRGKFVESQRALILQTLQIASWVIGGPSGAAARLGLNRTTLVAKMKKLGISRPASQKDMNRLSESRESEVATGS
jgi:transcriptional regulator with GAF, ATPase, and Fis domain